MKLSVVVPAHNEEEVIEETLRDIVVTLDKAGVPHEVVLVNDNSNDSTPDIVKRLSVEFPSIRMITRSAPGGFGRAVRDGLLAASGEAVVVAMGDASDDPKDIVRYYRKLLEGYDCVFGSRFVRGSIVRGYPPHKLFVNRLANAFIQVLFGLRYNDCTNAFKAFRMEVIHDISPMLANHFNMTVELPLKAINRGYRYAVIPINWYGRTAGVSKLSIRTLGRKYLFTVLFLWLERHLMSDEVRRTPGAARPSPHPNVTGTDGLADSVIAH